MSSKLIICNEYKETLEKNIKKKYKIRSFKNISYDFCSKDKIEGRDLEQVVKFFKNKNNHITLSKINSVNGNYKRGILPTLIKISALCYFRGYYYPYYENATVLFLRENMDVYLLKKYNSIIISFRGRSNIADLKSMLLDTLRVKYKFINKNTEKRYIKWHKEQSKVDPTIEEKYHTPKIHSGTYELMKYHFKYIMNIIKETKLLKKKNPNIVCTGHSMGGMAATICSIMLKDKYPNLNVSTVTFGAPGIGNRNASRLFKFLDLNGYIRVYNRCDSLEKLRDFSYMDAIIGNLRQANSMIPNKCILDKNDKNQRNKKYILFDSQKYLLTKFKAKLDKKYFVSEHNTRICHEFFRFSSSNKAPLFYV